LADQNNNRCDRNTVVASVSVSKQGRTAAEAAVTIRFPQVDPAGIVFYPRYFEMVYRCFPDMPMTGGPVAIKTQFLRPNRLGDELLLRYDASGDDWSVTGLMNGREQFSMRALAVSPPSARAHDPASPAFATRSDTVGDWMSDRYGRMALSRYFEVLNIAIEEWFESTLGLPFHQLHVGRKIGIPTVQFDTNLRSLPAHGDPFSIWIRPVRLGSRAMTFRSWLVSDGECLVENEQVVVFVRMLPGGYESIEIPDYARSAFEKQLTEDRR
jgi:4-hydroxybenzoyl-CoA thioesterase